MPNVAPDDAAHPEWVAVLYLPGTTPSGQTLFPRLLKALLRDAAHIECSSDIKLDGITVSYR
jgi:hypothetical protein